MRYLVLLPLLAFAAIAVGDARGTEEAATAQKPDWRFGVGRMNRDALRLKRNGATVWEVTALKDDSPEAAYQFLDLKLPRKESKP